MHWLSTINDMEKAGAASSAFCHMLQSLVKDGISFRFHNGPQPSRTFKNTPAVHAHSNLARTRIPDLLAMAVIDRLDPKVRTRTPSHYTSLSNPNASSALPSTYRAGYCAGSTPSWHTKTWSTKPFDLRPLSQSHLVFGLSCAPAVVTNLLSVVSFALPRAHGIFHALTRRHSTHSLSRRFSLGGCGHAPSHTANCIPLTTHFSISAFFALSCACIRHIRHLDYFLLAAMSRTVRHGQLHSAHRIFLNFGLALNLAKLVILTTYLEASSTCAQRPRSHPHSRPAPRPKGDVHAHPVTTRHYQTRTLAPHCPRPIALVQRLRGTRRPGLRVRSIFDP